MSTGRLHIDLSAIADNWRALASMSQGETGAVVKADGYGMGAGIVARTLAKAGCRRFFVAMAEEGAALRKELGPGPMIGVFSGHMAGDSDLIRDNQLAPMINSVDQMLRHVEALPGHPFGIQLDTGMNRLGMEAGEWAALRDIALSQKIVLIMSHMSCADEPGHPMNQQQLQAFTEMTEGLQVPRSLSATAGHLLGKDYHFELTRPGIGLYGGLPFADAKPVVSIEMPVIQVRDVEAGESVGYANAFTAPRPMRVATVSSGYADGLIRALGENGRGRLFAGDQPCPTVGRVSMDLICADVSHLSDIPETLSILGRHQSIDDVADAALTIGHEILTSLGHRYARSYSE
ncbi:alanine racemase [Marinibacterium profundimaris]|uniref:Alanine racemase n=1 Tax=Marinibacterium profundimaris TaxID=1679460 RepID=A0A225NUB4_9RHOB|nr:alanine racemase [Marinibacterium profundimaris]OWU77860.1 alanine racemase [Marinibacterium profundimaris]